MYVDERMRTDNQYQIVVNNQETLGQSNCGHKIRLSREWDCPFRIGSALVILLPGIYLCFGLWCETKIQRNSVFWV